MVNPVYLVKKGTMRMPKAATLMLRNLAANHFKMLWPEPWVDRAGRARGNWLGILHLVSGKCEPGKILHIKSRS